MADDAPLPPEDSPLRRIEATRRTIVKLFAAAAGWSASAGHGLGAILLPPKPLPLADPDQEFVIPNTRRRLHFRVIRPQDFIYLDVELENLRPDADPATQLLRADAGRPSLLIVYHQPQAIADQAFQQVSAHDAATMPASDGGAYASPPSSEPAPVPPAVAQARMAMPSRVAFVMPSGVSSLPYTLPDLLDALRTWPMNLDLNAAPDTTGMLSFAVLPALLAAVKGHFDQIAVALGAGGAGANKSATSKAVQQAYSHVAAVLAAQNGNNLSSDAIDGLIRQHLALSLEAAGVLSPGQQAAAKPFVLSPLHLPGASGGLIAQLPTFTIKPGKPHQPGETVTAIELPYRLIQSPLATGGWYHSLAPQAHGSQTEVWHTRLGARDNVRIDDTAPQAIRAIWSPDYPTPYPTDYPFTMSLDGTDRQMLVRLTAGYDEFTSGGFNIAARNQYIPKPAIARRLMLTSLGGWLLEDGDWPVGTGPAGVDLTQWNHRAAMARDYYVRVVYAGYLFPFGHAASLVKVTERKFENPAGGGRVALLRQRFFIIVRQKTKTYPGANQANAGRDFPFTRVDILTTTTPDLAEPGSDPADRLPDSFYGGKPYREAFWPITTGAFPGSTTDFMFQAVGYDQAGSAIPFNTPLFFLSINRNDADDLEQIIAAYATVGNQSRRQRPFKGAVVQFAPNIGSKPGDTNTPTISITFAGAQPTAPVPASATDGLPAQFYPNVETAALKLTAVQRLLGTDQPINAKVADAYIQNGLDEGANPGQVFLSLVDAVSTLTPGVPTDKGGGLVTPNLFPTALSRTFGTVAGAANAQNFVDGSFNPKDFLGDDLKLFGIVPLGDILAAVLDLDKAPQLVNQELPDKLTTTFTIHQEDLQPYTLPGTPDPIFIPNADDVSSVLDVTAVATVERNGAALAGPPTTTIDGGVNNFKVNLFGCIILTFDSLTFSSKPGQKPNVNVGLNKDHGVVFGGPLEFVNTLKDYIPANGFNDPPGLSVTAAGITASYSLALPAITLGVLTLQNISIGAGFNLPFDGSSPSAKFNFAERANPFNLTVSLFGGGGFFAIAVSTAGVDEIEAQLEFGAYAALDIGIASGSVYVKGGFYFHWQGATHSVDLEAFVELGGHLSVLGLISVTLTFHVDLAYHSDDNGSSLIGQATLTVDVEVLFFSKSVSMTVEKQFAGSSADPKFIDFIPDQDTWQKYCQKFG